MRWCSLLDDLWLVDKADVLCHCYRPIVEKLYAIEVALGPVTGVDTLHLGINLADAFDFPVTDDLLASLKSVHREAQKRLSRRKRLQRLTKIYKKANCDYVPERDLEQMELDLQRDFGNSEIDT